MDKTQEALKLALEALEQWNTPLYKRKTAITAIREALAEQRPQNCGTGYCSCIECPYEQPAQPQQEPVARVNDDGFIVETGLLISPGELLYTSPPASKPWVGLTDEQFKKIKASLSHQEGWDGDGWDLALKEAIEAKLKEKNNG